MFQFFFITSSSIDISRSKGVEGIKREIFHIRKCKIFIKSFNVFNKKIIFCRFSYCSWWFKKSNKSSNFSRIKQRFCEISLNDKQLHHKSIVICPFSVLLKKHEKWSVRCQLCLHVDSAPSETGRGPRKPPSRSTADRQRYATSSRINKANDLLERRFPRRNLVKTVISPLKPT